MSSINKHKVMQEWVQPFLDGQYLYFENIDAYPHARTLIPNYGDYVNKTDITGAMYKSYSFLFVGYETVDLTSTSDRNIDTMEVFDKFNEWLEEQKKNKNFPNFGDNCSDYDIIILQNMANLATVTDDNLAKFILGARIDYVEREE